MRLIAGLLLAAVGCGTDVQTEPEPQGSTDVGAGPDGGVDEDDVDVRADAAPANACEEAVFHSDYTWIQQKIFNVSCTASVCHGGATPKASLDLTAGTSYGKLVNAASTINTSWLRVAPGNPGGSILMVRFGGEPGPTVTVMPPNQPPLCVEKIDAVRRWIMAGAPNN